MSGRPITPDMEGLMADHPAPIRAIELRLREVVLDAVPEAIESVDMPDRLLAYGLSPRMRDLLFAIIAHRAHVNLQLADGAQLADPEGLVEGTGKRVRHVKCRSVEDVARPGLQQLVEAQVARVRERAAGERADRPG